EAAWVSHELPGRSVLRITCRGGFYVRSLARDLGRALGCGAHLSTLRRTAIGPWRDPGPDRGEVITGEALIPWCRARRLDEDEARRLGMGQPIASGVFEPPAWALPEGFPDPAAPIRALHGGKLMALLKEADGGLRTFANLRGGI